MGFFYTVREGDYLSAIARACGFADWKALYEHPANDAFRAARPDPNILEPGDKLYIPANRGAEHSCTTDTRLLVEIPVDSDTLEVELRTWRDEPYANAPYSLAFGGELIRGHTDGNGLVRYDPLPRGVTRIELTFANQTLILVVGALNPHDTVSGIQGRLLNLSYYRGPCHGVLDDATRHAIAQFKRQHDLGEGPRINDAMIDKLSELHGC